MSAIFERISIRKYEKKSVSDEMIKKICIRDADNILE